MAGKQVGGRRGSKGYTEPGRTLHQAGVLHHPMLSAVYAAIEAGHIASYEDQVGSARRHDRTKHGATATETDIGCHNHYSLRKRIHLVGMLTSLYCLLR